MTISPSCVVCSLTFPDWWKDLKVEGKLGQAPPPHSVDFLPFCQLSLFPIFKFYPPLSKYFQFSPVLKLDTYVNAFNFLSFLAIYHSIFLLRHASLKKLYLFISPSSLPIYFSAHSKLAPFFPNSLTEIGTTKVTEDLLLAQPNCHIMI